MTSLIEQQPVNLPSLVDRAATALANAKSAAEVLEARDMASVAYDVAKMTARLANAKQAHDDLIAAVFRAQADALVIEAQAKRRLADEYDAAQHRGEITTRADQNLLPNEKKVSAADIGLTHKDIHEAREIRDAEAEEPGVVRRVVDEAVAANEEPTKAKVRRAVKMVAHRRKPAIKNLSRKALGSEREPAKAEPTGTAIAADVKALKEKMKALRKQIAKLKFRRDGDDSYINQLIRDLRAKDMEIILLKRRVAELERQLLPSQQPVEADAA